MQSELFARPRLAGLAQAEAIITPSEEQALIGSIDEVELSPFRFHGWLGKRLTASFGWNYDFDTARFAPTEPIPALAAAAACEGRAVRTACPGGSRSGVAHPLRHRCRDRLASGSSGVRARRRHLARCARDDAIPAAQGWRLRSRIRLVGAAVDLSFEWRSASPVGTQHSGHGSGALVDHLPQPGSGRTLTLGATETPTAGVTNASGHRAVGISPPPHCRGCHSGSHWEWHGNPRHSCNLAVNLGHCALGRIGHHDDNRLCRTVARNLGRRRRWYRLDTLQV